MAGLMGVAASRMGPMQYQMGRTGGEAAAKSGAVGMPSPAFILDITTKNDKNNPEVQQLKRTGKIECQTCKERKYQDGSNDPGVSFKAPGHISPESSGSTVMAHEQEHVGNEQSKARQEGREVIAQSVRIFTSVCPECGKVYVSGGETRTTTADRPSQKKEQSAAKGNQVDFSV